MNYFDQFTKDFFEQNFDLDDCMKLNEKDMTIQLLSKLQDSFKNLSSDQIDAIISDFHNKHIVEDKTPSITVKVKLLDGGKMPEVQTKGSAGADLHANIGKPISIYPGQTLKLRTGVAVELPEHHVGLIFGRSGLGIKHGIAPANCVGVIDSDYRGEIIVGLHNSSDERYIVYPGDRIAQMLVFPIPQVQYELSEDLSNSERGSNGFGSTGN